MNNTERLRHKAARTFQEHLEHHGYDYAMDWLHTECTKQPFLQEMVGQFCELYFKSYKYMLNVDPPPRTLAFVVN